MKTFAEDDENEDMIKVKPPRPPRKKVRETLKEPLYEEDIIEGFSFVSFKTYDDLEVRKDVPFPTLEATTTKICYGSTYLNN